MSTEITATLASAASSSIATDWNMLIALSSAFIALCALGVSIWQGYLQRQFSRLSTRPHLTSWFHFNKDSARIDISVLNNGLGPALIKEFSIFVDSQKLPGNAEEALLSYVTTVLPAEPHTRQLGCLNFNYVLGIGEERKILELNYIDPTHPSIDELEHIFKRTKMRISYDDIYGESFTYIGAID